MVRLVQLTRICPALQQRQCRYSTKTTVRARLILCIVRDVETVMHILSMHRSLSLSILFHLGLGCPGNKIYSSNQIPLPTRICTDPSLSLCVLPPRLLMCHTTDDKTRYTPPTHDCTFWCCYHAICSSSDGVVVCDRCYLVHCSVWGTWEVPGLYLDSLS